MPEVPGLSEPEELRRLGYPEPPEVLEELRAAAARGTPLALVAAEGSGKELLYAVAAGARIDPASPEVQGLGLAPTREAAARIARAVHALNRGAGLQALVWPAGADAGPAERPAAQFLAGRPEGLLAEVRAGRLPLSALRLLVLDGVDALLATGAWAAAEAFLDTLGPDAQRILCAAEPGPEFERIAERRLARARRWPPEFFLPGRPPREAGDGGKPVLWFAAAEAEETRLELLARGLGHLAAETDSARAAVHCPDEATAHRVASGLAAAGVRLTEDPGEEGVTVAWGREEPAEGVVAAAFGLPPGLAALRERLGGGPGRLAVVRTRHAPQLGLLARRAGWSLRSLPELPGEAETDAVERFRAAVRGELDAADPAAELLLLEPLLEERGAAAVAAALARLLRRRGAEAAAPEALPERSVRPAWTRIFLNVGKRDGAGPGDLVGAITGETEATGAQIGKIEIRSSFSLVDVDSQIADEVIRRLHGARIKGRDVVARAAREA